MENLHGVLLAQGAARAASLSLARCQPYETERMRARRESLSFQATHAFVAAFPFFAGYTAGNLPLYTRGADYKLANEARLENACRVLRALFPDRHFWAAGNAYPLPAVQAARLAGLGSVGRHGLLIVPGYGSTVTLGAILCDLALPDAGEAGYCHGCGACIRACPTGAIYEDASGRRFDKARCRAYLSQQAELSASERALLRGSPWALGCDDCQNACPENRSPGMSVLPEYTKNLCAHLDVNAPDGFLERHQGEKKWRYVRRNLEL